MVENKLNLSFNYSTTPTVWFKISLEKNIAVAEGHPSSTVHR